MNRSIHDYRVFNFAILDILGTILGAYIIYRYKMFSCFNIVSFSSILAILIVLGIFVHLVLEIPTTLNNFLGLSKPSERSTNNKLWSIYNK